MDAHQRIFNVLFIAVFSAMLGLAIVGPLMPIFAQDLGATGIWLGIIFSSFSLARAIFMPIFGKISDRTSRKKFITLGLLLYSLISLLYLLAYNVWSLTIIRFAHGIASAMVIPITMAYVGETTKEGTEGRKMGLFNIAFFLGMGTGPMVGGILHDHYGMDAVFIAMAILTGFSFLLTLLLLPDLKPKTAKNYSKTSLSYKKILKNKLMRGLLIYRFINALGRGGVMSFLPIFAAKINLSPSQIGIILTFNIFLTAILQGVFGFLADKINKFILVIIGATLGAISLILTTLAQNFWQLMLLAILMGLGGAISMPAASAINIKIGKNYGMGTVSGLFNMAMSLGMILAPILSGIIMDLFGVEEIFIVAGSISILGIIIFAYYVKQGLKCEENWQYT